VSKDQIKGCPYFNSEEQRTGTKITVSNHLSCTKGCGNRLNNPYAFSRDLAADVGFHIAFFQITRRLDFTSGQSDWRTGKLFVDEDMANAQSRWCFQRCAFSVNISQ
jgi:hypothetical protein